MWVYECKTVFDFGLQIANSTELWQEVIAFMCHDKKHDNMQGPM